MSASRGRKRVLHPRGKAAGGVLCVRSYMNLCSCESFIVGTGVTETVVAAACHHEAQPAEMERVEMGGKIVGRWGEREEVGERAPL